MNLKDSLIKARIALLLDFPFYGNLALHLPMVEDNSIPTFATDYKRVYYNKEFAESLSDKDKIFVLGHEVLHNVFLHGIRMGEREPERWNFACFTSETVVSGDYEEIKNVKVDQDILCFEGNNKVNDVMKREYSGDLYKIKANGIGEIKVTPEHPFLILRRGRKIGNPITFKKRFEWVGAKDLDKNCYLVMPKLKPRETPNEFDLIKYAKETHRYGHNIKNKKIILNKDVAWLMGLYLAEGSSSGNQGFNLGLGKTDEKYLDKIYKIVNNNFNTHIQREDRGNVIKLNISSVLLERAFTDWFGRGAKNKKIPDFILYNKDEEIIKEFIDGYVCGDGHIYRDGTTTFVGSASKKLILQLQMLLTRLDIFSNFSVRKKDERMILKHILPKQILYCLEWRKFKTTTRILNGKTIDSNNYRWKDLGNYFVTPIVKIEKETYSGIVYNLSTENHNYMVNNVVVHNCDFVINAILKKEFNFVPEGGLYNEKFENMTAEEIYNKLPEMNGKGKNGYRRYEKGDIKIEIDAKGNIKVNGQEVKPFDVHKDIQGSKQELDELEKEWAIQLSKAWQQAKMAGKLPAGMDVFIEQLLAPKLDWRNMLRQFVITSAKSDFSWLPSNRRFIHQDMYMPSITGESLGDVTVIVDVSGSTGGKAQQQFLSECNGLLQQFEMNLHLLTTDVQVTSHHQYNQGDEIRREYKGMGGTDLRVAIDEIAKRRINPSVVIIFTDGYTPWPDKMKYPTLWVITKDGVDLDKVPFGMKVKMND